MKSVIPSPSSICRPPSSLLTIALAQMDVLTGQPDANLARARDFAAQARDAGADLLLLPELWFNGYDLERAEERATPLGEGGFAHMAELAREFGLYLAGSLLERHAGGACGERRFAYSRTVSNTAVLYAPDGVLLGSYRKIHRFRLMQEHRYLAPGDCATLCPTPWGPTGLAICYDLRFPELFRVMALAGAVLFLVPAQWPVRRVEAWLLLARARAAENELIVAACNRVGNDGQATFPGRSLVVDPWGNVLVEGDDREGLLIAQADLREIRKARRYLTVYEDRRPDAYRVEPAPDGQHPASSEFA
jgi:omega-amidase